MLAFIEYYNVRVYEREADQLMELLKPTTCAFVDAVSIRTLLGKLTVVSGATLSKERVWVIDQSRIYKALARASGYQWGDETDQDEDQDGEDEQWIYSRGE